MESKQNKLEVLKDIEGKVVSLTYGTKLYLEVKTDTGDQSGDIPFEGTDFFDEEELLGTVLLNQNIHYQESIDYNDPSYKYYSLHILSGPLSSKNPIKFRRDNVEYYRAFGINL